MSTSSPTPAILQVASDSASTRPPTPFETCLGDALEVSVYLESGVSGPQPVPESLCEYDDTAIFASVSGHCFPSSCHGTGYRGIGGEVL